MATVFAILTAQSDHPLILEWLNNASKNAGDFLKNFAEACLRADPENYKFLRALIHVFRQKYPQHEASDAVNEYPVASEKIALHEKILSHAMVARYVPKVGDYFVVQSDGYEYINPKDVFERKYRNASEALTLNELVDSLVERFDRVEQHRENRLSNEWMRETFADFAQAVLRANEKVK